jgi:hypothetical protein
MKRNLATAFSKLVIAAHRHGKSSINRVVIRTKQDDIPAKNEESGRPMMMTSFILTRLERQISKYPVLTTAELKLSLSELSSLSERSIRKLFIAF